MTENNFKPFLLATYGTLKKGHSNHRIIKHCKFIGSCLSERDYIMFSVNDWYPAVVLGGDDAINMEIFEVEDQETADNLDMLEGYPDLYIKDIVNTPYGDATIYLFNRRVDNLKEVEPRGNWIL